VLDRGAACSPQDCRVSLGERADAVPGFRNRMMVFMVTRMTPRAIGGFMFKRMLGRALKIQAPLALVDGRAA
jgi:hypothetical protein